MVEEVQVATARRRSARHRPCGVGQVSRELHRRHNEVDVAERVGYILDKIGKWDLIYPPARLIVGVGKAFSVVFNLLISTDQ